MTKHAVRHLAEAYISDLLDKFQVVNFWHVVKDVPGEIRYRIPKNRYRTRDTQGAVLKDITKRLGQPTAFVGSPVRQAYSWDIGSGRTVELLWFINDGTYVALYDTEAR